MECYLKGSLNAHRTSAILKTRVCIRYMWHSNKTKDDMSSNQGPDTIEIPPQKSKLLCKENGGGIHFLGRQALWKDVCCGETKGTDATGP